MDNIINKIEMYEILNFIIPGFALEEYILQLTPLTCLPSDIISKILIALFFGVVLSRIGTFAGALLNRLYCVKRADIKAYYAVEETHSKLTKLNMINNMYRTFVTLPICAWLVSLYCVLRVEADPYFWDRCIIALLLCGLFIFSYIKQTNLIKVYVQAHYGKENEE